MIDRLLDVESFAEGHVQAITRQLAAALLYLHTRGPNRYMLCDAVLCDAVLCCVRLC
jgi:hypothetical protein